MKHVQLRCLWLSISAAGEEEEEEEEKVALKSTKLLAFACLEIIIATGRTYRIESTSNEETFFIQLDRVLYIILDFPYRSNAFAWCINMKGAERFSCLRGKMKRSSKGKKILPAEKNFRRRFVNLIRKLSEDLPLNFNEKSLLRYSLCDRAAFL